jgi:hypothetical protein
MRKLSAFVLTACLLIVGVDYGYRVGTGVGWWPHIYKSKAQPSGTNDPCGSGVFYYGNVLSAGQWLTCFNSLERSLGYPPVNRSGDIMSGPLGVTQVYGASGTPSVAAGSGAGTSPTVTLTDAHDTSFGLSVVTGSSPATASIIATVTFSTPWLVVMHCTMQPSNANAAGISNAARPFSSVGIGLAGNYQIWVVTSNGTALNGSTTYTWDVLCG